ncbi:hypothetical protein [Dactylococcopsis salina]|uniref:hypothetical protein n=1 Tax=Dactylococcopsis salina TaxID=292566 RepID=UPI0002EBDF0A|nr:hypothetical protein [Dactylococcopsis salina]
MIAPRIRFPVDFDIAWKIVGYSTKAASAKRKLTAKDALLTEGDNYLTQSGGWSQQGRFSDSIYLTIDAFKQFCLMAQIEKRPVSWQYLEQAEKQFCSVYGCVPLYPADQGNSVAIAPNKVISRF